MYSIEISRVISDHEWNIRVGVRITKQGRMTSGRTAGHMVNIG